MAGEPKDLIWKNREHLILGDEVSTSQDSSAAGSSSSSASASAKRPEEHPAGFDRRGFLKASGFTLFLSALTGCEKWGKEVSLGMVNPSKGVIPGRAQTYASVCGGCSAACGVLIKSRDGRPIKLEGNPLHPLSRGGLCAVGQASILGLYDSRRTKLKPMIAGKASTWEALDEQLRQQLDKVRLSGGSVRFLTGSITSPTTRNLIQDFLKSFPDGKHVVYDALSSSAILDAHQRTHGQRVLPRYRLDQADLIVSFDADFLGTWISPVEYTAAYQTHRAPTQKDPRMSHHVHFESRLSITGSKADERVVVTPEELKAQIAGLAVQIAKLAGVNIPMKAPVQAADTSELAQGLWKARGKSLVLSGCQDTQVQVLVNFINHTLENYGKTLDLAQSSSQRQGNDAQLQELLKEINSGKVSALFVAGVDPLYELPLAKDFSKSIGTVVRFAERMDASAALASSEGGFFCPVSNEMESWSDSEPVNGVVCVNQPTLRALGDTRPLSVTLSNLMGSPNSDYQVVRAYWEKNVFSRKKDGPAGSFQAFWDKAVHDGCVEVEATPGDLKPFNMGALQDAPALTAASGMTLVLYPKVGLLDGRHAYNPWLQELPDPISKLTWDNYACLSPAKAKAMGVADGDVIGVGLPGKTELKLPAFIQPGQHDDIVAVALGYGSEASKRFDQIGPQWLEKRPTLGANGLVGAHAAGLLDLSGPTIRYEQNGVTLKVTGTRHPLATSQLYSYITVPDHLALPGLKRREAVLETTLAEWASKKDDKHAGHGHGREHDNGMWPDDHHTQQGKRWGMLIDLNKCTGCSACVIACQAENNIPVVGKDEVRRGRDMHWMRIDRYYAEREEKGKGKGQGQQGGSVDVAFQPMLCHHCDNAPCETVCPVLATAHSSEGLNEQIYNRCVGTRYCANNCPYKVRRFNWFKYRHDDETQNLALNPDVTVRSRGVMEKCSFCVQRIQEAKIEAKRIGTPLADGDIQPACQQSCPAQAIVFGDANDPGSQISTLRKDSRHYHVLEELNIRPSVGYMRLVRGHGHPGAGTDKGSNHG